MPQRKAGQRNPRHSLGFEQLEDRRLLSGSSLLGSVQLPLPVPTLPAVAAGALLSPAGLSVSAATQDNALAPALTAAVTVTTNPSTASAPAATLALQLPLVSVSAAVNPGEQTGSGGSSALTTPSGGGSLTIGVGQVGSANLAVSLGGSATQVSLLNQGGSTPAGQAAQPVLPPSQGTFQANAGNTSAQPGASGDSAPFLVSSLQPGLPSLTQAATAVALSREVTATAGLLTAVPVLSTASFAGEAGPGLVPEDALPTVGDGVAQTAVRAASYTSEEEGEDSIPAPEVLPSEATEAGLMGLLPADGTALDETLRQLLEQLNNLGQGLNQMLPGGLAFWLLAGAVGVTACLTVRRRQASGAVLSGEALAWIPSLAGFLPPAREE
jgi:hypothetical protein